MAEQYIFTIENLTKAYGKREVLKNIWLAFYPGAKIGVIGSNGAGKSTLLRVMALQETDFIGSARAADGITIGFVPQEREIFPSLSVRENLAIAARPGLWTLARVFELFPRLKERLSNAGNQLSGGEQQMLSIARALLTNPTILLMDEPTEGLAPVLVEALTVVLRRLREESGLSIMLVEQNSRVALAFSARTVILDKGRIVYDGESQPLRSDPDRLAQLIGIME